MVTRIAVVSAALASLAQAFPQVSDVAATGPVITVKPGTTYQVWDGTGISEAFQRSLVLHTPVSYTHLTLPTKRIV